MAKKTGFWSRDWFLGVLVTLVMLIASGSALLESLERKAYDMAMGLADRKPSEQIAIIAVDDHSIANLGRWPWPRDIHARLIDQLALAKPKVIGNTIFYFEPQLDPGYRYITQAMALVSSAIPEGGAANPEQEKLLALLGEAEGALNTDRKLASSLENAGNVVLPMLFDLAEPRGRTDKAQPPYVVGSSIVQVREDPKSDGGRFLQTDRIQVPIEGLGAKALYLGHLTAYPDVDGIYRAEPLLLRHFDKVYPSMSLMVAAASLNLGPGDVVSHAGESVSLGNVRLETNLDTLFYPTFYGNLGGRTPFQIDSFYDVLTGKIPASKYAGKIVLIGATAAGAASMQVTPVSSRTPAVETLAHVVSSILNGHYYVSPYWGTLASLGAMMVVGLYLALVLPRLGAGAAAGATLGVLVLLLGAQFGIMLGAGIWVQLMGAAALLLLGHLLLTTKRFLMTERGKERSDQESAESNRMLGLAFQGQGQLDMAFDKFRKCPMDDGLMENLYNLALDYERKRQFNKAEAVFRYMGDYSLNFRDLPQRIARAKQMSETVMLAGATGKTNAGTLILGDAQIEKPMLGRYQVEKELGKGAMGVVYQGRDPKINRVVAIKTMALAQEFDEDELAEVKQRFFREAETAGRLNHPNIVTMYDAGEEHDLAYIAMEFLKGRDLVPQSKPGQLLPLPKLLSIIARVADALDYAHAQNVVHRDIKPANLMYEAESDQLKVTDFGIARITDSSRTKTGMVLGTPSYMSPEQLAGKKIDGRSDLFSLGVTLYQLSCGQLPFSGDSLAQLMFKIANEPHPDIRTVAPAIPACVAQIIDKAMCKDETQRYQRGSEMAADLRSCLATLGGTAAS